MLPAIGNGAASLFCDLEDFPGWPHCQLAVLQVGDSVKGGRQRYLAFV